MKGVIPATRVCPGNQENVADPGHGRSPVRVKRGRQAHFTGGAAALSASCCRRLKAGDL